MNKVYVEVPDPLEGWLLAQRVLPLQAQVRAAAGERWELEVAAPDGVDQIVDAVRAWLRDEELPATQLRTDGQVIVVRTEEPPSG
jgi:hypothetical protein